MLGYLHRDIVQRVIKQDDIVIWTNAKRGSPLRFCRVVGATPHKVSILFDGSKTTRAYPGNLMVVTEQLQFNIDNYVGANL